MFLCHLYGYMYFFYVSASFSYTFQYEKYLSNIGLSVIGGTPQYQMY